jgi:uncharacterized membrane protein YfcA
MTPTEILVAFAIGLFTGFFSGLMGIGGGALGTPLIRLLLNAPPLISLASTMPVMLPSATSGAIAYFREKKVDFKLAGLLLLSAIPMTLVGAEATRYVSGRLLMLLTAFFLLLVGTSFLLRQLILKEEIHSEPYPEPTFLKLLLVGSFGGFLAGLLAIGGGVVYVPAILRVFKRPMKVALSTSLIVVMAISIPGTIRHAMLGHINWWYALVIGIATIPSSYLGAKLALRLRNNTLERIFGICTMVFGIYFLISQW